MRRVVFLAGSVLIFIVTAFIMRLSSGYVLLSILLFDAAFLFFFRADIMAVTANSLYVSGKTEKARPLFIKAMNGGTKSPSCYVNFGVILLREGDGEGSLRCFERALEMNPKPLVKKNIELSIGSAYWLMKEEDRAINHLEEMRIRYEYVNPHVLTTLGFLYILKGNLEKAEELTREAIADDESTHSAWDNLGQIAYLRGDFESAKEGFQKALEIKPTLVDSLFYLGLIFEKEGYPEKAKGYFSEACFCEISGLNTVTREQVDAKFNEYQAEDELPKAEGNKNLKLP